MQQLALAGPATRWRWLTVLVLWTFALLSTSPVRAGVGGNAMEPELLKVEDAFRLSAGAETSGALTAEWTIAEGYYLYRDRIKFKSNTPGVTLGEPEFPPGKLKRDEFFGEVETYRHGLAVQIPVRAESGTMPAEVELSATFQGCADVGVCYPPHTQTLTIAAVQGESFAPTQSDVSGGFLSNLGEKLGFGRKRQTEFPPAEKVFIPSVTALDANTILARWDIAEGFYLYRDKFGFSTAAESGISLGAPQSPPGEFKDDETFGRMEVYHRSVEIRVPVNRSSSEPLSFDIEVKYQGCADAGFCYPPEKKLLPVSLPAATTSSGPGATASDSAPFGGYISEQDQFAQRLQDGNLLITLAAFYGVGLLLAFTPCVFPMIPILSSIVAGQGMQTTTRKAFTLSLAYVLAMALTYTIAGVIAGLTGANLQAAFQNPWIVGTFSLVFVALAFSMFGFYELQVPSALQSKLTSLSNKQQGGTVVGAGIMGFLSALIVGPCVAAPLAGALIYISQSGDAVIGGLALFSLSMGMGTPLLLIGTSAGKILPRVGDWMNTVKATFGVMLLALAVWMLARVIPPQVTMLLWAMLAIVIAVYLGALRRVGPDASGWQKLWQGLGLVSLVYGVILMLGVASGGEDPLNPLGHLAKASAGAVANAAVVDATHMQFTSIKGLDGLQQELAAAKKRGQPAMLDFYADWCVSCKEMERFTFSDERVQAALANTHLLQADVTDNDDIDQALLKQLGIVGPPAILFFDPQGTELRQFRVVGFMKPDEFLEVTRLAQVR